MSELIRDFFTWAGICYSIMLVAFVVFWAVSKFYDRWEVRIRRRLGKENQALKRRVRELESRFETESDK